MTFYDNKKRLSFRFFSGSPGKMRVKIHKIVPTAKLTLDEKAELKARTRTVILNELLSPWA